jgi:thiosulfate/3-mercaptopyruvate sulfurtransferase
MVTHNKTLTKLAQWATFWLGLLAWSITVAATTVPSPLVDTQWVATNLDKVVILDVRDDMDSFEKRSAKGDGMPVNPCGAGKKPEEEFNVFGHIPNATLIPIKNLQVKRKVGNVELKGMFPLKEDFEKLMQGAGVNSDSAIVITSKGMTPKDALFQTLLYWALKYFGHDNLAILNGGTAQWVVDKREMQFGKTSPATGNFKAGAERAEILATTADVLKLANGGEAGTQLIDVRGRDVYWGLTFNPKYVTSPGKGHLPTAKNFPLVFMVNSQGPVANFYSQEEVLKVAELSKIDTTKPTVMYCDSGGSATIGWFIWHELLGNQNVRLYDGSMHEWTSDASRPVAVMKNE